MVSIEYLKAKSRLLNSSCFVPPTKGHQYPKWFKLEVKQLAQRLLLIGLAKRTTTNVLLDLCQDVMLSRRRYCTVRQWVSEASREMPPYRRPVRAMAQAESSSGRP